jgi:hypothetical protein
MKRSRRFSARTGEVREPKTQNGMREVPIEAALRPLVVAMNKRGRPADPLAKLLAVFGEQHRSRLLKGHLGIAGVTRPGLLTNTATTMAVNFRSCRDSGITWLALSGLDVARIQRRAGHDDVQTTLAYVKMPEDIKGKVGIRFPPLPVELLGQASGQVPSDRQKARRKWAPTAGLELQPNVNSRTTRVNSRRVRPRITLRELM